MTRRMMASQQREVEQLEWKKKKILLHRILGGKPAKYGEFPFIATLEIRSNFGYYNLCGGSALTTSIILTAAHCIKETEHRPDKVTVKMGNHNIDFTDSDEDTFAVKKILMHSEYNSTIIINDIALLLLDGSFVENSHRSTIARCSNENMKDTGGHLHLKVLGWGLLSENGDQPSVLQKVTVPFLPYETCKKEVNENLHPGVLCAGNLRKGGVDSCQGDSGGPLVHKNHKMEFEVAGIVSYGFGCGRPNSPGYYTNVAYFKSWIDEGLKILQNESYTGEGVKGEAQAMGTSAAGGLFADLSSIFDFFFGISRLHTAKIIFNILSS